MNKEQQYHLATGHISVQSTVSHANTNIDLTKSNLIFTHIKYIRSIQPALFLTSIKANGNRVLIYLIFNVIFINMLQDSMQTNMSSL